MKSLTDQIRAAKRVSAPLVAISTPDAAATVRHCIISVFTDPEKFPPIFLEWDIVRGLRASGCDEQSYALGQELISNLPDVDNLRGNPIGMLEVIQKVAEGTTVFFHQANRMLGEPAVIQGIWNLRDQFKLNRRMLVLLGPSLVMPAELAGDVLPLEEPLPDGKQLRQIIEGVFDDASSEEAEAPTLESDTLAKAIEALSGLPSFAAEQCTAMSLRKSGLDVDGLWERKRKQIEETPGLKVWRGGESFSDIAGVANVKEFVQRVVNGKARPGCIVFIDEIEKMLAGVRGDTSGVSQDQLGMLLSYMQDHSSAGMIFIGPPGSAKSMVAKAAGNAAGVPTIQLDLGAAKGSLVGQSEQQLRTALKVVTAVSGGRSLWIATCNSIGELPPELRRRFTLGTFFFDLPSAEERNAIWRLYTGKMQVGVELGLNDEGWTGAEIKQCCDIAWRLGCTIKEAASYVVPVAKSAKEQIDRLRDQADSKFLSASYPGVFRKNREEAETKPTKRRALAVGT